MHILQFEYVGALGRKTFLKVHNTFKHHYTGETMRFVQLDYMEDGEAETYFIVINEAEFEFFYNHRIEKETTDEGNEETGREDR